MKLNIKEITKAIAPKFWIYDPEQIEQTIDYVDKSYINMIKYTLLNGGKWRLRTESVNKYIVTTHNASSLGLTIFFDERNAQARLARLKGGLN